MALKIVKANEPINIKAIWATIYAQPGLGKTSLAFTSSNPLLLDFDSGIHRAADRKDAVQISKWSDIAEISARDVADYDTIVIDTVGQALDSLSEDILLKNHRHGYGGTLNQQGWCQLCESRRQIGPGKRPDNLVVAE